MHMVMLRPYVAGRRTPPPRRRGAARGAGGRESRRDDTVDARTSMHEGWRGDADDARTTTRRAPSARENRETEPNLTPPRPGARSRRDSRDRRRIATRWRRESRERCIGCMETNGIPVSNSELAGGWRSLDARRARRRRYRRLYCTVQYLPVVSETD